MQYMFLPFRRFFDFQGRSRRMEYWMFVLFNVIVATILTVVFLALFFGAIFNAAQQQGGYQSYERSGSNSYETGFQADVPPEVMLEAIGPAGLIMFVMWVLYSLIIFIPSLAVTIRRLHDTNRSGWWVMLYWGPYLLTLFLPLLFLGAPDQAGPIAILILLLWLAFIGGAITLLVFMFLEGTRGPNRFGPDPKGPDYYRTFA